MHILDGRKMLELCEIMKWNKSRKSNLKACHKHYISEAADFLSVKTSIDRFVARSGLCNVREKVRLSN